MVGPNRPLLEQFYDIQEQDDGAVLFQALDQDRTPGLADWVALDRYDTAPAEVKDQYYRHSFAWPFETEFEPKCFPVEYQPDLGETVIVSLICNGPSLSVQDTVDAWFVHLMSTESPAVAFAGNVRWVDTGKDGIWVLLFTCDFGDSGHPEWLQRLFSQLTYREILRASVGPRPAI